MIIVFWLLLLQIALGFAVNSVVINTWAFREANQKAWEVLKNGGSAVDAVEAGCSSCEEDQCDFTVGYGGSPDENGETVLDAMIMDGHTMNVGAVAGLRRIKTASSVARKVLELTTHSLLVGDLATEFAKSLGFPEQELATNYSTALYQDWKRNHCQPNFWTNVNPDPSKSCGPYKPKKRVKPAVGVNKNIGPENHDTIGIIAIDGKGCIAAGTSSNGAKYKIAGRVGDSPIPGAGCYADEESGAAAAATGDGDIMMRFLPSFVAVDEVRRGAHPIDAAKIAIKRISSRYPAFQGGIVVVRADGKFGAACHGLGTFPYTLSMNGFESVVLNKTCV